MEHGAVLPLDHVESTDTGPDVNAHALSVFRADLQTRMRERFVGSGKREMDEAPHLARFFLVHKIQWIETLHLSRERDGKSRRIEAGDRRHSALAGQQVVPDFGRGFTYAAEQPDARNNHPSCQLTYCLSRFS